MSTNAKVLEQVFLKENLMIQEVIPTKKENKVPPSLNVDLNVMPTKGGNIGCMDLCMNWKKK